jgi:hypothetical protein
MLVAIWFTTPRTWRIVEADLWDRFQGRFVYRLVD